MKLLKLGLATLIALGLFSSCQQEKFNDDMPGEGNGIYELRLGLEDLAGVNLKNAFLPERTSAKGGITNVDLTQYDLRYIITVMSADGTRVIIPKITKVLDTYQPISMNLRLNPNRTYKFVVWADFVKQGETEDLHYNTADLTNITCKDAPTAQINDESRDAFTISEDVSLGNDNKVINLVLRRPFAKIRVVTTDWNAGGIHNDMPDNFKVTYYGAKRFNNYNAVSKESAFETLGDLASNPQVYTGSIAIDKDVKYYDLGYDATPANRTLVVDYLMTDKTEQTPIHFKFEALDGTNLITSYDFKTNVPIQRNYLTTLLGNMLTRNIEVNISIDEHFIDEYNDMKGWFVPLGYAPVKPNTHMEDGVKTVYEIRTPEELMYIAEHPEIENENAIFRLYADIDMEGVEWMPIGKRDGGFGGPQGTFDGQGHTMRNFNINKWLWESGSWITKYNQVGVFGVWYGDIKDVVIENVTINGMDGTPEHPQTSTWFTGGVVGYFTGNMTNVTVKHVFIKSLASFSRQNIGGLIGYTQGGPFVIKDCYAEDIHVRGSQQGGLIGSCQGKYTIEDCTVDYIHLRTNYSGQKDLGVFIGDVVEGDDKVIKHCTVRDHYEVVDDKTGLPSKYEPLNKYVGSCRKNADKIQIIE